MCTLPSPDAARKIVSDNRPEDMPSSARDGPLSCSSPLIVQTYCDASFAPGGGPQPLRDFGVAGRLTALSAPEAEVVALSEALMPAIIIHESCRDIGLEVEPSPDVLFVVKTDSQVTLTQLRSESVTTRSRPFANKFNLLWHQRASCISEGCI